MSSVFGLLKPEYLLQPRKLLRRVVKGSAHGSAPPGRCRVALPWANLELENSGCDLIMQDIQQMGVYELPVTEALWRLVSPGDTVIDVGANIGYEVALFGTRLASGGRIIAFEPVPAIHRELVANAARVRSRFPDVAIDIRCEAASDQNGSAFLAFPPEFSQNRGTGSVDDAQRSTDGVEVRTRRLDDAVDDALTIEVMKVDVEGHEAAVFRGAREMLKQHRIRHIIFEEHRPLPTESSEELERAGYTIYRLERSLLRLRLADPRLPFSMPFGVPNYLATSDVVGARKKLDGIGWKSLTARV